MNLSVRVSPGFLELAAPDCVAEDFGGEIVAINLDSGLYFSVRGLAAAVWSDLAAGHSVDSVCRAVGNVDKGLGEATRLFVDQVLSAGLMRAAAGPVAASKAMQSEDAARAAAGPPVLEQFDDMMDLLKADPIHEVDEQLGWPVRRN
jgi:hypothetical protein